MSFTNIGGDTPVHQSSSSNSRKRQLPDFLASKWPLAKSSTEYCTNSTPSVGSDSGNTAQTQSSRYAGYLQSPARSEATDPRDARKLPSSAPYKSTVPVAYVAPVISKTSSVR